MKHPDRYEQAIFDVLDALRAAYAPNDLPQRVKSVLVYGNRPPKVGTLVSDGERHGAVVSRARAGDVVLVRWDGRIPADPVNWRDLVRE